MSNRTVRVVLEAVTAGYQKQIGDAATATKKLSEEAKEAQDRAGLAGKTFTTAWGAAGVAAMAFAAAALNTWSTFESAMSGAEAATRETGYNLDALRAAAIKMGAETKFSAIDAAHSIQELGRAGISASDILGGGLRGSLDLAAAGNLDVAEATQVAAIAMTQFNLRGKDVPHVADLLAAGAGKAQGDVHDLSMALRQGGMVASQFGLSIDETVGGLASFANAGLLGSDAGTSLKIMLLRLANPSKEARLLMSELGITTHDTSGKFIGLAGLAGELQSSLSHLSEAERQHALAQIFGTDAIRAATILYRDGESGVRRWASAVSDSGYAARQAAILQDNLAGDLEKLGGAWDSFAIAMHQSAEGPIRGVTQALTALVTVAAEMPGVASAFLAITTGLGGLALAAAGVSKATVMINDFKNAAKELGTSTGNIMAKATLAGAGFAALSVIVGVFANDIAKAADREATFAEALKATNGEIRDQNGVLQESVRHAAAKIAQEEGLLDIAEQYGIGLAKVTDAMTGNADAAREVEETVRKANAASAEGAMDAESAFRDYEKVKDIIDGSNTSLGEAADKHRQMADAVGESGSAATDAAASQQVLAESLEAQAEATSNAIEAINNYYTAVLSLENSEIALEAAYAAATESIKKHGETLDLTTEDGRANAAALVEIAESALRVSSDMGKAGASSDEISASMETARERFIEVADKMGHSAESAAEYANKLGLIPEDVATRFATPGSSTAQSEAQAVNRALDNIPVNISSRINVSSNARAAVADVNSTLNTIAGKTVTAYVAIQKYGQGAVATGGYGRHVAEAVGLATGGSPVRRKWPNGGIVEGPGTTTSDSIPAMLSRREFVQRAAAVDYYGVDAMYALNAMRIPRERLLGYASGGSPWGTEARLISSPVSAGGQPVRVTTHQVDVSSLRHAVAEGLAGARIVIDGRVIDARIETANTATARRYLRG